jgi:hypothetical protein
LIIGDRLQYFFEKRMRFLLLSILVILAGFCISIEGALAAYDDALHTEVNETGEGRFEVDARGNSTLPLEFIRQAALLRAAEATLKSGAPAFRILRGQKRTITRRRPPYTKSFAIFIEVETKKAETPPSPDQKWLDAKKVVNRLVPALREEAKNLGIWKE